MTKLVAIGGGKMAEGETLAIDSQVVALTGKINSRALFIPTASSDSQEYWQGFQRTYAGELGCETDVLYLLGVTPTRDELERKILTADLVYVGGGNTLMMMRRWRRLGVDAVLEEAYRRGIVLSGLSAGCICWFSWGHSDSMSFYQPDDWSYIKVRGMGLVDALACPHYDSATAGIERRDDFQAMMRKHSGIGLAIDDHCALEIIDDTYRVITSREGAGAYKLTKHRGHITVDPIPQHSEYRPLAPLLQPK